jgi:hypothetical protein
MHSSNGKSFVIGLIRTTRICSRLQYEELHVLAELATGMYGVGCHPDIDVLDIHDMVGVSCCIGISYVCWFSVSEPEL